MTSAERLLVALTKAIYVLDRGIYDVFVDSAHEAFKEEIEAIEARTNADGSIDCSLDRKRIRRNPENSHDPS